MGNKSPFSIVSGRVMAVFIAGLTIGILISSIFNARGTSRATTPIRLGQQKYTNPLLAVDLPEIVSEREYFFLKSKIDDIVEKNLREKNATDISVYFKNSTTGEWLGVNTDKTYHPASLMKIPTLIAFYKMEERLPGFLEGTISYRPLQEDFRDKQVIRGSKASKPNTSYQINELISYMVTYSDNNAGIVLNSILDKDFAEEVFTDLGLEPFQNDTPMTVKQFSIFFRTLYNATYLSRTLSERALGLLTHTEFADGIRAGVREEIEVANKFGEYGHQGGVGDESYHELHDCGIIYYPEYPYFLCVMTRGKDINTLKDVISSVSKVVYENVDQYLSGEGE